MAIDARYQDNVVLKQDAFQNLLTNIKNYPIIDIDYVAEMDTDELHGDTIWEHYTNGIPCIKITYGDDRSTKGNIIFAEDQKKRISDYKKEIAQAQVAVNELVKRKNRWEKIYNENHAIYLDKDNQIQRFVANHSQIEGNKLAFLKAGWDLLYIPNQMQLNIDDPYEIVPADAGIITEQNGVITSCQYDPATIYYVHSDDYFFKRYDYTYMVNDEEVTVDVYKTIKPQDLDAEPPRTTQHPEYDNMRRDWANKVRNYEIYIRKENATDQDLVILNDLGAQYFQYQNILLTKNPYRLVYPGDNYDSNKRYFERNSATNTFNPFIPSSSNTEDIIVEWRNKVNNRIIYIEDNTSDEATKTYNLTYTTLGDRAAILSQLNSYKNLVDGQGNSIWRSDPNEKEVFQNFIQFIMAYNKLVFLDTIGIAGYTASDIEILKDQNPNMESMIHYLANEDQLTDFDWESFKDQWDENLPAYYSTFKNRISDIVNTIKDVINVNLDYIRSQIRNLSYTIVEYNVFIEEKQDDVERVWHNINTTSTFQYDPVIEGSIYNPEREYYTKDNEEHYILYEDGASNWNDGIGKFVKNDRTMYGYKYVKVGSNIEFNNTYTQKNAPYKSLTEELERTDTPDNQASGTFRLTVNKHTYEVPIKGFGLNDEQESNQPIKLATSQTLTTHSKGNTIIRAKNDDEVLQTVTIDGILSVNGSAQMKQNVCLGTTDGGSDIYPGKDDSGNIGLDNYQWGYLYVNNIGSSSAPTTTGYISTLYGTNIGGNTNNTRITNVYGVNGNFTNLTINGTAINNSKIASVVNGNNSTAQFWRGDASWSNTLTGNFTVNGTITGGAVKGAVFNDYAEYRATINLEAGRVVIDQDDGTLKCSDNRLLPGAQVISDTFGFSIGEMEEAKTPLAIAGRVLVYTYQNRENYHAGMAVCSAPNGTVDIMTREEIKEYPDCIIGIVSEIPEYEEWGTNKVKVNNRIWIKIK